MKKTWYKEAVVYQIYPRSFKDSNDDGIGDLKGITSKIEYLANLGITCVWLSPVYASPMADMGYDISDYYSIAKEYGTMEDFDEMLAKFHQYGIKVVMDLVVNHTSDEHMWFKEAKKSVDNKYHDFYFFKDLPNNWTSFFEGSAWEYVEEINQYYLHLFDKKQPDLNWNNPEVRNEVKKILKFWLDKGVDGFRCDVVNIISKNPLLPDGVPQPFLTGSEHYINGPKVHEYLNELYNDVFAQYDCFTVGECGTLTPLDALTFVGEGTNQLSMVFQFDHVGLDGDGFKWNIKPFKRSDFKKVFSKWQYALKDKGWNTLYLSNHDQPRSVSRYGDLKYRRKSQMMLFMFLLLQSGTPYIFQGEEIGMTNCHFKDLNEFRDVETYNIYETGRKEFNLSHEEMMKRLNYISRDNARTPMQWDDTKNAGFTNGTPWIKVNENYLEINAFKDINSQDSIYNFLKKLLNLRKVNDTLVYGDYLGYNEEDENSIIYQRFDEHHSFFFVANYSSLMQTIDLPFNKDEYELVLNNYEVDENVYYPYQGKVYKKIDN